MPNLLIKDLNHILKNTKDVWKELKNKKIFITGGTGFIGCWLLESFVYANEKLNLNSSAIVLTRNLDKIQRKAPHLFSNSAIKFIVGDIRSFSFPCANFSDIIHAAAETESKLYEENPMLMLDILIQGTKRVLDFAVNCNAERFLLVSSGAIYGEQPSEITNIREDFKGSLNPIGINSVYGFGKSISELLCVIYAKEQNLNTKIARCFAFVGPYLSLDSHFAIGNFINNFICHEPIVIKGDGTPYRSYLYAADLVIWLWNILVRGETCKPYNVGSEKPISICDLAELISNIHEPKLKIFVKGIKKSGRHIERYVPSTKRARLELNLEQKISLQDAIKRTINWYIKALNY